MDKWENLINFFPVDPDVGAFNKMLQTAAIILKEDLADFEIRRYLKTLFLKPISLIEIIESRRNENAWPKSITEAFKLIGSIVETHGEGEWMQGYYTYLSKLCMLNYDATTQTNALLCLTSIVKHSQYGAFGHKHIFQRLEMSMTSGGTCKATLAILFGTICEYYPDLVREYALKIFRIYLKMMDSNKNTVKVTNAILKALNGVFKSLDLPTCDLLLFYAKISTSDLIKSNKHEEAILTLLQHHAGLFREKVAEDHQLRRHLWSILAGANGARGEMIAAALLSVYRALCDVLDTRQLEETMNLEVLPKVEGHRLVKYTALRVITCAQRTNKRMHFDVDSCVDVQKLEFELRNENASYECADAIKWSVESSLPNSKRLLQTAVLFYNNLPTSKTKDIVVEGVLNADDDLRQRIITLLINETCLNETTMGTYLPLWEMLFDTEKVDTLKKHTMLLKDYVLYLSFSVQMFLDEADEGQDITQPVDRLLYLTSHILSCLTPMKSSIYMQDCCTLIADLCLRLLRECCATVALVKVVAELMRHCEELPSELYEYLSIDRCRNEAILCASCISLIQAPEDRVKPKDMLIALEIIFSRNDVEPKMLIKSLQKLECYMNKNTENVKNEHLLKVMNLVEKLRLRRDLVGKDARVLQRDVVTFLGKYSTSEIYDVNSNGLDSVQIVKLKLQKLLILDITNTIEGAVYKLSLERILQQALKDEDPETLQCLLTIICDNLSRSRRKCLQTALCRVLYALCRVHSHGFRVDTRALIDAAHMCATSHCAILLTTYISDEKSPGVRRMISDALETLLKEDKSPDGAVSPLNTVAEHAMELMESAESTKRRAGLDITQSLIASLHSNHSLLEKLLPRILVLVTRTGEVDSKSTFEEASRLFIKYFNLFKNDAANVIEEMIRIIIIDFTKLEKDTELKIYKDTVKVCLVFINSIVKEDLNVFGFKRDTSSNKDGGFFTVFDVLKNMPSNKDVTLFELAKCDEIFQRLIYILAISKNIFDGDLDSDVSNSDVLERFFDLKFDAFRCKSNFDFESTLCFIMEYNGILMDSKYQETQECVASLLKKLQPSNIIYLYKLLPKVLTAFKTNDWPKVLVASYQNWLDSLPIDSITKDLNDLFVTEKHVAILKSIKIMSEIFKIKIKSIEDWPMIVYKGLQEEQINVSQLSNLTDALTAATMTATYVKRLMTDNAKDEVLEFIKTFMEVFFEILVSRPFLILDEDLKDYCLLIKDIVKWCNKKKLDEKYGGDILELVNEIWPLYVSRVDFHQARDLLHDLLSFPLKLKSDSPSITWAKGVLGSKDTKPVEKLLLIGTLPGGEDYMSTYKLYASELPVLLSEMCPPFDSLFRALLDAVAVNGDLTILDIALTLAKSDDTEGWWDSAIESCAASLAVRRDPSILEAVYRRCYEGATMGICKRLMVPLLRCSSPAFCELFFSKIIKDLLDISKKRQMAPTNSDTYHEYVMRTVREFTILQIAFEMIPASILESPSSLLYKEIDNQQNWHIVRSACKLCITFRENITCPDIASREIAEACRHLQCAAFNCLVMALCCRQPAAESYNFLFNEKVWSRLVDMDIVYTLPLKSSWNQKTKRHSFLTSVTESTSGGASTLSLTRTVRTRMFADRLSEDPLHFDMFKEEDETEEEIETQDIRLTDNVLNNHEVSGTLTHLLCQVSPLDDDKWLRTLTKAFQGDLDRNTKWVLAQAVCNAKEELKRHARELRPALLALIKDTTVIVNGARVLNGLHIEILETIHDWGEIYTSEETTNASKVIEYLIMTHIVNIKKENIYKNLTVALTKILSIYKSHIRLEWRLFEPYFQDDEKCKQVLQLLSKIAKNNITVCGLAENLIEKFCGNYTVHFSNMAELFGLAIKSLDDSNVKSKCLTDYSKILEKHKRSETYVKLLYYAQVNCIEVCDLRNFRIVMTLVSRFPTAYKTKCLRIISSYISEIGLSDGDAKDVFASLDICQMVCDEDITVEAIRVANNGYHLMESSLKRRCVKLVAGFCQHSMVKVRKSALEFIVLVFKDIFEQPSGNAPKRQKTDGSKLLKCTNDTDETNAYYECVLRAASAGCIDGDHEISSMVKAGVAACLDSADMRVRFAEAFLVTILSSLPDRPENTRKDLSVCLSAFLDVLFYDLKSQDSFKSIKLRDEPLDMKKASRDTPKMLTMSRSYQGTMRSEKVLSRLTKKERVTDSQGTGINVQVTVESILDTIQKFSKINMETSKVLCIEMMRILFEKKDLRFDFAGQMSKLLRKALINICSITPLIIEGARLLADDIAKGRGIEEIIGSLKKSTLQTEGEMLIKILYEDVVLRTRGNDQFVIESSSSKADVVMAEEKKFSIQDLVSTFGKLANWDQLTMQQKECVKSTDLPLIWTSRTTFREHLVNYKESDTWFGKMCSVYHDECERRKKLGLKEGEEWGGKDGEGLDTGLLSSIDIWPRRLFVTSAITEIIHWELKDTAKEYSKYPFAIQNSDCLAEWAARLMIRSARMMLNDRSDRAMMLSRSDELEWCVSANERELFPQVLQCIDRNKEDLYEDEILPWFEQRVVALRNIALETNDEEKLKEVLKIAGRFQERTDGVTFSFLEKSSPESVTSMYKLILQLNCDLNSLTSDKLDDILKEIEIQTNKQTRLMERNKQTLTSVYLNAMVYYSELTNEEKDTNETISNMLDILNTVISLELKKNKTFLAMILNKFDNFKDLDEQTSRKLFNQLQTIIPTLDQLFLDILKEKGLFSVDFAMEFQEEQKSMDEYKMYFQLINDVEHCFWMYCEALIECIEAGDRQRWKSTFANMKKIFENPFQGTYYDNNDLKKCKKLLYQLEDYDPLKKNEIINIRNILPCKKQKELRLPQLCKRLVADNNVVGHPNVARLLGLPPGVTVVKFDEEVKVFTDTKCRPCLFRAILSNGESRKYLHKCGEPMRVDRAALSVQTAFNTLWRVDRHVYNVTPLSEDCGLIEYLEDHERLRTLITGVRKLESFKRTDDLELILTPVQELVRFHDQNCSRVPSYCLRSAIKKNSANVEEFIWKKNNYLNTLATMTVLNWILGLGDRHLNNTMYSYKDGGLVCIDWTNIFKYGAGYEPAPARLTRNVLAVCDVTVLESKIQRFMKTLRGSYKVLMPYINVTFQWMGDDYFEKRKYIEGTLKGTLLHIGLGCNRDNAVMKKINGSFNKQFDWCLMATVAQGVFATTRVHFLDVADALSTMERFERKYIEGTLKGTLLSYEVAKEVIEKSNEIKYKEKFIQLYESIFPKSANSVYSIEEQVATFLKHCTDKRLLGVTRKGWEPWI